MSNEENEPFEDFQEVCDEMILAIENLVDKSWSEISNAESFDGDKLREHENFVALFERFKNKYSCVEY